jgi:hypothetical protein
MQARFIHRLLEDGMTVEQVAAASRKTASEVRNLITAYVLYAAACSLDLDSNVHGKIANPRTFPLSALERAFESKLVCDFLGVQRNDAKLLSGRVAPSEFLKGFTTIVSDVATGKVNTRKLNNNEGIKQYLESIKYKKPDLSKKGTFEIQQLVKTGASVKGTPKPPTPKKKTPRPSASVIPTIIKCSCASKRIKDVFGELRRLHLEKFPNASAVLLRTLIDLCVTNFLERTKEMKTLLAHHQTKNNKQKDWAPSLHQMLDHLLHKMDCGLEGQALTALRTFHSSKRTVLCLDGLDKFTHNKYLTPQPDELKNIWTIVEPLMEIILVDPE